MSLKTNVSLILSGLIMITFCAANLSAQSTKTNQKMNIAVLNLKSSGGVTSDEAEIITDRLRSELFNTGMVNIMERDQMAALLKEEQFQMSGMTDSIIVAMGKKLGVKQIVAGSIGKVGTIFLVNLRIIDVQTAQIVKAVSRDLNGLEVVVTNLGRISNDLFPSSSTNQNSSKSSSSMNSLASDVVSSSNQSYSSNNNSNSYSSSSGNRSNGNSSSVKIGIRAGSSVLFGSPDFVFNNDTSSSSLKSSYPQYTCSPGIMPNINLKIAFGGANTGEGFFTILTGGLGIGFWQEHYTYNDEFINSYEADNETFDIVFATFSLNIGANFGIAFGAFHPSIGLQLGLTGMAADAKYKQTDYYTNETLDSYNPTITGNTFSIGLTAGFEYMINHNLGIDLNFMFLNSEYKNATYTVTTSGTTYTYKVNTQAPGVGIDFGLSYYF